MLKSDKEIIVRCAFILERYSSDDDSGCRNKLHKYNVEIMCHAGLLVV
jgi:hypothetical protein